MAFCRGHGIKYLNKQLKTMHIHIQNANEKEIFMQ